jgi:hypothetical protein
LNSKPVLVTPQKLIVTLNFPSIPLEKDAGGFTKEVVLEQMRSQHCDKFEFEDRFGFVLRKWPLIISCSRRDYRYSTQEQAQEGGGRR